MSVGPTIEEIESYMDEDNVLPEEIGGIYLGYAIPSMRGLLCFECATEEYNDGTDITPHVASQPFGCARCRVESGDVNWLDLVLTEDDDDYC